MISVNTKLSAAFFSLGIALTLASNLSDETLFIGGFASLIAAVTLVVFDLTNAYKSAFVIAYALLLGVIFLNTTSHAIFHPGYLVSTMLVLPSVFLCLSVFCYKGNLKNRVISGLPCMIAILSLSYCHFLTIATLAASI